MTTRRDVLATLGAAASVAAAGCGGGGGGGDPNATTVDENIDAEEVTLERGDGWTAELPELPGSTTVDFAVVTDPLVTFDVYVFRQEGYDAYTRFLDGETGVEQGPGLSGASRAGVHGTTTYKTVLEAGQYYVAVDYSNYRGMPAAAGVDESSPEETTLSVGLSITSGAEFM